MNICGIWRDEINACGDTGTAGDSIGGGAGVMNERKEHCVGSGKGWGIHCAGRRRGFSRIWLIEIITRKRGQWVEIKESNEELYYELASHGCHQWQFEAELHGVS